MKITVVANYFGTPPDYFQLWLDSASFNQDVSWLFFSDFEKARFCWPDNVRVIRSTPAEMRQRFIDKLGFPVYYRTGWDFCYYKTVLGKCFEDELAGADYWAWTDCDLIYGDLRLATQYCGTADKIMPKGHFSLLRNIPEFNDAIARHPLTQRALQEYASPADNMNFDEECFPKHIIPEIGM